MQGTQKLRSEAHLQVRRNDEVAAQRRRWTFYETLNLCKKSFCPPPGALAFWGMADGARRGFLLPGGGWKQGWNLLFRSKKWG